MSEHTWFLCGEVMNFAGAMRALACEGNRYARSQERTNEMLAWIDLLMWE